MFAAVVAVLHVISAWVCVSPLVLARVVALATVGGNCCSSSGSVWIIMIVCVVRDRAHGEATRTIIWWCEPAVVPFSWATSGRIHDCAVNIISPTYLLCTNILMPGSFDSFLCQMCCLRGSWAYAPTVAAAERITFTMNSCWQRLISWHRRRGAIIKHFLSRRMQF